MFEIVNMTIDDIVEAGELLKEAYEKDAILGREKPNLRDVVNSLARFVENESCFMYVYKENNQIMGACGFIKVPSIVDATCLQAVELACNPLYYLNKVAKGKIFIRMLEKMEQAMSGLNIKSFITGVPKHLNSNKYLTRKGYMNKEISYVKEIMQ